MLTRSVLEIDLIFMKSISRLGGNTLDNVHYIRTLKAKDVYIRFEEESVDTASKQREFMLTIMRLNIYALG